MDLQSTYISDAWPPAARLVQPIVHPPASSVSAPGPARSLAGSPPMTIFHGLGLAASSSGRISALSGMWPRCWDVTYPTSRSRNVCRWVTVTFETWLRSAERIEGERIDQSVCAVVVEDAVRCLVQPSWTDVETGC